MCFAGLFAGNRGIGASAPTHLAHCCLDPNQTPPVATHDKAQSTRSTSSHQIPLASTSGKHPNPHPMGAPPMAVDRKLKKIIPYQKIIGYITLLKNPPQLSPHTRVCGMIRDFNKINNILSIKATIRDTSKNHTLINQQKSNKVTSNLTKTTREHTPITIHTYKNKNNTLDIKDILPTKNQTLSPLKTKSKTYPKPYNHTHKLNPQTYETKNNCINQTNIKPDRNQNNKTLCKHAIT